METIACPDCDLLQELPELPPGAKARCPRCACTVASRLAEPIDLPLALTVTAAIAFIIANTAPLMSLSAVGRHASTTIGGGAKEMLFQGEAITAMIVAFCAVIAPAGYILFMLTVSARGAAAPGAGVGQRDAARGRDNEALVDERGDDARHSRCAHQDRRASLGGSRHRHVRGGALVILFPAIMVTFDEDEIWQRVEWADGRPPRKSVE